MPEPVVDGVSDLVFDALADPVRREILALLSERERCSAGEVASRIDRVGRTAVSSHLRVLRTAGLVSEQRSGRFRYYAVATDGPARDVIALLQHLFRGALTGGPALAGRGRDGARPDTETDRAS